MDFDELLRKAIEHKATVDSAKRDITDNTLLISKKEVSLKDLTHTYTVMKQSSDYLDVLVKEESGKFIKMITGVLDYGVKTIFDDRDYSIEIRVTDTGRASIHLVYDDEDGNKIAPDIQEVGGGIRTVVGSLMQVYFILLYHLEPLILIDEGLSQISSQYLPNFMRLMEELSRKNGLKILLITHDTRLEAFADRKYQIVNGHAKEIKVTEGSELDECYSANVAEG